jgi:hypothetical protein
MSRRSDFDSTQSSSRTTTEGLSGLAVEVVVGSYPDQC